MRTKLQFRPRAEIQRDEWDSFVDASEEAWLWHRSEFIDARSTWSGYSDASFGVLDEQETLLAVMPMYLHEVQYARILKVKRLYSEGGPATAGRRSPNAPRRLLAALEDHLETLVRHYDAEVLEARIPPLAPYLHGPNAPRVNPLVHIGLENTSGATWMINLQRTEEEIRKRYSETTRQEIRKAQTTKFMIREASGNRDIDVYYRLHLDTIERFKSSPDPIEFYKLIFERFQPQKLARIVFFERDGKPIAAHNTALYKRGAYYWTGASTSERSSFESRVLFDNQIVTARALGCTLFEAGQAYIKGDHPSILNMSTFKRTFGSEMVTVHKGRIRSLKRKFEIMRAAARAFPRVFGR